MLKVLVVLVTMVGGVYLSGTASAPEKAALSAAAANVPINRCTLEQITTAQASKCKSASYSSLTSDERSGLDQALSLLGGGGPSAACQFWVSGSVNGWSCANGSQLCTCVHDKTGPMCGCTK